MEERFVVERSHSHCKFAAMSLRFGLLAMQTLLLAMSTDVRRV
jgi:hypothetical protein